MLSIGIIGFGFMGRTHWSAYRADGRARVTHVVDPILAQGESASAGNISGGAGDGFDPADHVVLSDAEELFSSGAVQAVSICTPTPSHVELAARALRAGLHVLVEKPLALSSADAAEIIHVAAEHPEQHVMPAMCMRFWPGWDFLQRIIASGAWGRVISARFGRQCAVPAWGADFYGDVSRSGGALLDLHVHDVDYACWCFGVPRRVQSVGRSHGGRRYDHVVTSYDYGTDQPLVITEAQWHPVSEFPFSMHYLVVFEQATVRYDSTTSPPITIYRPDRVPEVIDPGPQTGYVGEVAHFLDIIDRRSRPIVTPDDAITALRVIEAERRSLDADSAAVHVALADGVGTVDPGHARPQR